MSVRSFDQIADTKDPVKLSVILRHVRESLAARARGEYICNVAREVAEDLGLDGMATRHRVGNFLIANGGWHRRRLVPRPFHRGSRAVPCDERVPGGRSCCAPRRARRADPPARSARRVMAEYDFRFLAAYRASRIEIEAEARSGSLYRSDLLAMWCGR